MPTLGLKHAKMSSYHSKEPKLTLSWASMKSNPEISLGVVGSLPSRPVLMVLSNNINLLDQEKDKLKDTFKMKDLGPIHWFLGLEIT